jgi:crotonobetainyl-CoA:carnitine CoA-transferase CaiB-like acyl-CoA transferase
MANHSLMCQMESTTRSDVLGSSAIGATVEPRDEQWWVTTDAGSVPVLPWDSVWDDGWVTENDTWTDVVHPDFGECVAVRAFAFFDAVPADLGERSPALGDANEPILGRPLAADGQR